MDEQKLQAFIQWLPTKFEEFQNKTPDEIAQSLNDLYSKGEEGKATLQSLWQAFEQESSTNTSMFKAGGKLDALVQKMAKGGKSKTKRKRKCACGCELVVKKAKGGIIEECACGCKMQHQSPQQKQKQVESYQDGGIPTQQTSWAGRKFGAPYQTTQVQDEKGKANVAQMITKNNTLYRVIGRPMGSYENKTWQIIKNQGTPQADTTYVSPRGNSFTPQQAPTWTGKFNQIFGTTPIQNKK